MMKITAIGTGNAFSAKNFNACFLLEDTDSAGVEHRLLLDCGQQVLPALRLLGIDIESITEIYISHAHSDHIGSLEAIGFMHYDWMNKPKEATERGDSRQSPVLIANKNLMHELWEWSLKGGMACIEGLDAELSTYFRLMPVPPNKQFEWCGWSCSLIQQVHIMTGSVILNTFGLMLEKPGKPAIYFTTDSQHCSPRQIELFYRKADIVFQDCECLPFLSGVHANYAQLAGHPDTNSVVLNTSIRNKMWLTHYQDFVSEGKKVISTLSGMEFYGKSGTQSGMIDFDWDAQAAKDGFRGFLKVGQVIQVD